MPIAQVVRPIVRPAVFLALVVSLVACGGGGDLGSRDPLSSVSAAQMQPVLARARAGGPGLAGGLVTSQHRLLAADGLSSAAGTAPLRTDQWFHLGSNGKSLTAMAVAVQVEAGRLRWSDTLAEVFPELAVGMRPEYRQRTVLEVLGFRAGLPALGLFSEFSEAEVGPGSLTAQRLEFVRWLLSQPPINVPGTTTAYSNATYVLAGAIVERASGRPFEQSLEETVLTPLGLRAAFGLPQSVGANQPAAHTQFERGRFEPVAPDDPLVLAVPAWASPAGLMCMPLDDYARYAQVHLAALRGRPTLLRADTYRVLHAPQGREAGDDAGLAPGWSVRDLPGGAKSYEFYGSIDVMNAYIKLLPAQDRGVVVLNTFDTAGLLEEQLGGAAESLLALLR